MVDDWALKVPGRMRGDFLAGVADGDLVSLVSGLALIDARMLDVLGRVDTGESGERWKLVRDAIEDFNAAETKENGASGARAVGYKATREAALSTLVSLADDGLEDYAAWREVKDLVEARRRLVDTEQRRRLALQKSMTFDQAQLFKARILEIVVKHVKDKATRAALSREFDALDDEGLG